MKARIFLASAVALVALASSAATQSARWKFVAPSGWSDVMPGSPGFSKITPEYQAQIQQGGLAFCAADLEGAAADGLLQNVSGKVMNGRTSDVTEALAEIAREAVKMPQLVQAGYTAGEKTTLDVHGVAIGRLRTHMTMNGKKIEQVMYVLPGGSSETAILTFTTSEERIGANLSVFDAAARATQGIEAAPRITEGVFRMGIIGGLMGGVVGALKWATGKKS